MNLSKWKIQNYYPFKDFLSDDSVFGLTLFPRLKESNLLCDVCSLAVDIEEDKNNLTVKADLPGLNKEDIKVSVEDGLLTIKAERKSETNKDEKNYCRTERYYGSYQRTINIGKAVDVQKVKAEYKNGVLQIVLPKTEKDKKKEIDIVIS